MQSVLLGNTSVLVSAICLGTMYFGNRDPQGIAFKVLDKYFEAGGGFLDTANIYSFWIPGFVGGESEKLLGKWMRERNNRSRLFIASKVGFAYPGVAKGLRAHQIIEECEKSLRRLGVETIDLYYSHGDDFDTSVDETMETYDRLVGTGKIRFVGASNFAAWRLEEALWTSGLNGWVSYCYADC